MLKTHVWSAGALMLALATIPSCSSTPPAAPIATAGLRVQVTKVGWSARNKRLNVRADIWNDHDQDVGFEFGKIRLLVGGDEASAKPGTFKVGKLQALQAKTKTPMDLDFDLPSELAAGSYTIELRDLKKGEAPLGEKAVFRIDVTD
jgi:hypothetical protein